MGLKRESFGTVGFGNQILITVPEGAESVISFTYVGQTNDAVTGATRTVRAVLSADKNEVYGALVGGDQRAILCSSEQDFPEFPVSAGETILVACEDAGSGVIWFRSAD